MIAIIIKINTFLITNVNLICNLYHLLFSNYINADKWKIIRIFRDIYSENQFLL